MSADDASATTDDEPRLAALVAEYVRERRAHAHREIELRIGRLEEGTFIPGTTQEVFEQLEQDFKDSGLRTNGRCQDVLDYYYTLHERGKNGRTRVCVQTDSFQVHTEHVSKESIGSATTGLIGGDDVCRVSVASETPIEEPPKVCMPTYVRLKQRCVYQDVRKGHVVWSYELSRSWSAPTRTAVEERQHSCEPNYEVECELVDEGGDYLREHTDEHVAASLLLKVKALLGSSLSEELVCLRVQQPSSNRNASKRRKRASD